MKCYEISVYDHNDAGPQRFGPRKLFKGGDSGGTSVSTQEIPAELKPLASTYAAKAIDLGNQGYTAYSGDRNADVNGYQALGSSQMANRAMNGSQLINTGENYLQNQLTSGPRSATWNPVGGVSAGENQYAGSNPYLQQNIDAAMDDVTRNYQNTVMPGQTNAAVSSGSFGNSGLQQMQLEDQRNLGKTLANTAGSMRMQDYGTQQQLAESAVGRDLQAQQFNSQLGQDWAGRNDSMYGQYANNNLQALGLAQQYGNQDYQDAAKLMEAGQFYQDQSQQDADFNYQQFQEQQNHPYKQLAAMSGVFGSNLGASSSTTQSGGGGK